MSDLLTRALALLHRCDCHLVTYVVPGRKPLCDEIRALLAEDATTPIHPTAADTTVERDLRAWATGIGVDYYPEVAERILSLLVELAARREAIAMLAQRVHLRDQLVARQATEITRLERSRADLAKQKRAASEDGTHTEAGTTGQEERHG